MPYFGKVSKELNVSKVSKGFLSLLLVPLILLFPLIPFVSAATPADYYQINQKVCGRFEEDTVRLSAIMEELRSRQGITETRVAYGNVDTPIERADYWVTYGAEAIAFQRAKKYSSKNALKSDLVILQNKILRAKGEVKKVLK